jgi:hypothetical protein
VWIAPSSIFPDFRTRGDRAALGPGEGKIELLCDTFLEEVDVLGQHNAGLHDVQIVQDFRIGFGQAAGEEVRLLLVVTFEADTIPGPDYHRFQQRASRARICRDHLSRSPLRICSPNRETF